MPLVAFVNLHGEENNQNLKCFLVFPLSPNFIPFPLLLLLSKPEIHILILYSHVNNSFNFGIIKILC